MALEQLNIKACYVGSAQDDTQIYTKIARGEFNIIYCTPELLQSPYGTGKRMLDSIADRLMLVAIDGESLLLILHFSNVVIVFTFDVTINVYLFICLFPKCFLINMNIDINKNRKVCSFLIFSSLLTNIIINSNEICFISVTV